MINLLIKFPQNIVSEVHTIFEMMQQNNEIPRNQVLQTPKHFIGEIYDVGLLFVPIAKADIEIGLRDFLKKKLATLLEKHHYKFIVDTGLSSDQLDREDHFIYLVESFQAAASSIPLPNTIISAINEELSKYGLKYHSESFLLENDTIYFVNASLLVG